MKAATDLPVAVGFGVRTPEQAGAIAKVADGVVVGSALVELVGEHGADAPAKLRDFTASLAAAVRAAATHDGASSQSCSRTIAASTALCARAGVISK